MHTFSEKFIYNHDGQTRFFILWKSEANQWQICFAYWNIIPRIVILEKRSKRVLSFSFLGDLKQFAAYHVIYGSIWPYAYNHM